jgi:hypothetical protein
VFPLLCLPDLLCGSLRTHQRARSPGCAAPRLDAEIREDLEHFVEIETLRRKTAMCDHWRPGNRTAREKNKLAPHTYSKSEPKRALPGQDWHAKRVSKVIDRHAEGQADDSFRFFPRDASDVGRT